MAADAVVTLPARPASLPALLDFARAFGRERDLPPAAVHRLIVILEELFLNTVHHGHGGGSDAAVSVELTLAAAELRCSYTDHAPLFVPPAGLPGHIGRPAEARPVGGLGVAMVRSLSSGLSHASAGAGQGNRIDFIVALPAS